LSLELGSVEIDRVHYLITPTSTPTPTPTPTPSPAPNTGNGMSGWIDTSAPDSTASVEVFGLLPGHYTVTLSAIATDDVTECEGSEGFSIELNKLTEVTVYMGCKLPEVLGGVRVNGELNVCAVLTQSVVKALQTSLGNDFDLSAMGEDAEGDDIAYLWTGTGGSVDDPTSMDTTYTCEEAGDHTVTIAVSDDGFEYCTDSWTTVVTCVGPDGPECETDEECAEGELCDEGECVPALPDCEADGDCAAGEVCEAGECVPAPPDCEADGDCAEGEVCEAGECVPAPPECENDGDCAEGEICESNECVPAPPECENDGDCAEGEICESNECVPAPPECENDGDCAEGEVCESNECVPGLECTEDAECGELEICESNECVSVECKVDGQCDDEDDCTSDNCVAHNCVHSPEPVGTVCGNDGQCTSGGGCTEGSCTNAADTEYVCTDTAPTIKDTLTACGICEILGAIVPLACPFWCDGTRSPPSGPAATCAQNTLLLGGNGGACTEGLSQGCLTCYVDVAACGTLACAASCSGSGAIGANGCTCIDCVNENCDAAFDACAGYATGRPNGTPSGTGAVVGGPPACEGVPTPACEE
jgi:hypothetical protein